MLINPNVKGGRSFFLTFLSFKNNDLAKKFVIMLIKKPFNINDLAARGPWGPPKRGHWRRLANRSQVDNDSHYQFI
tara:strand:+ start:145 stop:372 length:228 start_codon:yes stop_codon:yes gene_type:complete